MYTLSPTNWEFLHVHVESDRERSLHHGMKYEMKTFQKKTGKVAQYAYIILYVNFCSGKGNIRGSGMSPSPHISPRSGYRDNKPKNVRISYPRGSKFHLLI